MTFHNTRFQYYENCGQTLTEFSETKDALAASSRKGKLKMYHLRRVTSAEKYIAQEDLELFHHFRSRHGTSCPQEILSTSKPTTPGAYPIAPDQGESGWRSIREDWSQVTDYHLLLPPVPDFFIGPEAKTAVFGVNAVKWEGCIEDVENFVLDKVKALGLKKAYPTLPITKNRDKDRSEAGSQSIMPRRLTLRNGATTQRDPGSCCRRRVGRHSIGNTVDYTIHPGRSPNRLAF